MERSFFTSHVLSCHDLLHDVVPISLFAKIDQAGTSPAVLLSVLLDFTFTGFPRCLPPVIASLSLCLYLSSEIATAPSPRSHNTALLVGFPACIKHIVIPKLARIEKLQVFGNALVMIAVVEAFCEKARLVVDTISASRSRSRVVTSLTKVKC